MRRVSARQSYWSEQNTLWEASGLSQQKFCEAQGLVYKQFIYWRGRLNRSAAEKVTPKLLKVSTASNSAPCKEVSDSLSCLEVVLPTGIKLHIKSDTDIGRAGALIQLLGAAR